jgi:antitoxin component of RelBE/YafQ-DinJ toxin-antitoxin module
MQDRMLTRMPSTSVRVDRETHEELKKLARELGTTVGEAVAIAARRLRQQRIGRDLRTPLTKAETSWLDADLG